ncbi:MAG: flagellar basal body P-ring formation chaperone FlgA [Pirellulaceae bacterium]
MKNLLIITVFAWAFSAAIALAGDCQIVVRSSARISESIVTLGDIAEIHAQDDQLTAALEAMSLTATPSGDRTQWITINDIRETLAARGFDTGAIQITGSSRSEIRGDRFATPRPSAAATAAPISTVANQPLQTIAPVSADMPLTTAPHQVTIVPAVARDPQVKPLGSAVSEESTEEQALHTTRNIRRGEILRLEDLEIRPVTAVRREDHYPTDLSALVGKELTHALAMDRPVGFDDVRQPILIRRNDIVTVISRSGNVTVRREVVARGDAGQGELLDVEPLTPQRSGRTRHSDLFRVIVTGPGEAQVLADSAQAATPNR